MHRVRNLEVVAEDHLGDLADVAGLEIEARLLGPPPAAAWAGRRSRNGRCRQRSVGWRRSAGDAAAARPGRAFRNGSRIVSPGACSGQAARRRRQGKERGGRWPWLWISSLFDSLVLRLLSRLLSRARGAVRAVPRASCGARLAAGRGRRAPCGGLGAVNGPNPERVRDWPPAARGAGGAPATAGVPIAPGAEGCPG
jgi:hypothetical protein